MKQRDRQEREAAASKVDVLTEALPWINRMRGKTFVIKYGGSAMEDEELCRQVVADIELLKLMGIRIVVVHGGGKAINAQLKALGIPVAFKDGLRVTDDATMAAVQQVLVGQVNQRLVWALNEYGHNAVGISGADGKTLKAAPIDPELGRVGRIREVDPSLIETILDDGYIPVIATVGCGADGFYNINADVAAGKIAEAMGADKLIYLTDVDGLYGDIHDEDSLIQTLTRAETHQILSSGELDGGMIPKIRSIAEALDAGVSEVVILNGTFPHSLLLEIFTDAGCGTMFTQD
ncbi:acetylglutamate kinase [Olsenella sp. An188]|uniref:acetylglutamate kinase n=1 Tax=Olsenella sp. An188 TaxID=1965579 RepID=UPI000B3906E3|nr:acetylglutamate kinase [Olsenella sp. An188]OUP37760.1 acetylglutamate kinase [Olsenella sp. An188]HJB55331.1 acetylglutamate kinase [Candidatus Olsenella avistercoris]